jgi:hypothetical protein
MSEWTLAPHDLLETLRRIALDVNHALMVLPTPSDGAGKRAWKSLIDAKEITEAAIDHVERTQKR